MRAEKVFIVASHSRLPSKDKTKKGQWEVTERVEFVNQLRDRHIRMSSVVVDFLEEKVIVGKHMNVQYDVFMKYINERYPKQMKELNAAYKPSPVVESVNGEIKVKTEEV